MTDTRPRISNGSPPPGAGRRGLALVSVLWVLTLLSLVAASFTNTTRTEINVAHNQVENAKAEAMADAGVYRTVLGLFVSDPEESWRTDGTVYAWRFETGEIRAAVWDEGGKIDLNVASQELLGSLFVAAGLGEGEAAAMADAIVDFRDPNDLRQLNGAEDGDYERAGLDYGAKDAPFEALEELRQVYGMTPALFDRVSPALTVFARQRAPHEASAPALVRAALAGQAPTTEEPATAADGVAGVPPELTETPQPLSEGTATARSRARVFSIHAEARSDSGAVFARDAVVRLGAGEELPFALEAWRQGRRELFVEAPAEP